MGRGAFGNHASMPAKLTLGADQKGVATSEEPSSTYTQSRKVGSFLEYPFFFAILSFLFFLQTCVDLFFCLLVYSQLCYKTFLG